MVIPLTSPADPLGMPAGAHDLDRSTSTVGDLRPALPLPGLPSAHLLRADGRHFSPGMRAADAGSQLALDAVMLLAAVPDRVSARAWATASFAREVEVVRAQLSPIDDPALLASSFCREAFLGPWIGRLPWREVNAARAAYAIRWLELRSGLFMPPWPCWNA